jgi:hypothetical protein
MSPEAQNNKTGPDAPVPLKTSPGAQNVNTGHDAHSTAENESRSAKQENETRRPQYGRKYFRERKTWKRDPTPSVQPKMSPDARKTRKWDTTPSVPPKMGMGAQNMKTGPEAPENAKNGSGR